MTLAYNWPKTVISSWHSAFQIASCLLIRKQTSLLTATGYLWLLFFLPLSRPETAHKTFTFYIYSFFKDTFRAMNTEASIPLKGYNRLAWLVGVMLVLLVSFTVGVVEDDGEGRGTTLWLLQSLAWQHWMLNELRSTVSLLKNWSKAVLNCRPVFSVKKSRRPLIKTEITPIQCFYLLTGYWICQVNY